MHGQIFVLMEFGTKTLDQHKYKMGSIRPVLIGVLCPNFQDMTPRMKHDEIEFLNAQFHFTV